MAPPKKVPPPEKVAEAKRLRKEGISDTEIGSRLGVSKDTIYRWLGRRSVPIDERRKEAMRLRVEEKLSNTAIAERMDVNYRAVHYWIGANPKNYRHSRALPQNIYEEAVRLRHEGKSNAEIANAVEIHVTTVYRWMGTSSNREAQKRRYYSDTRYHNRAMYLRECGYNITEISQELGIPRSTIGGWVKGYGCYGQPTE